MFNQKFNLIRKRKYESGEGGEGGESDPTQQTQETQQGDDEGKKPSDREAELLREVMKRKGNEQTLKTELQTLKEQLTQFEGIDPESVRALLKEKQDRETAELEKRGEFDRVKEQMLQAHNDELTKTKQTFEGQVGELSAALEAAQAQITELTIGRSFSDSSFVRDSLTLTPAKARVVFGSHFELKDGAVVAYDKPSGAQGRTVLVNGSGEPLPFDEAIAKIVAADPDADHLIRSKVKSGAGSNSEKGTKGVKQSIGSGRDRITAAVMGGALSMK